VERYLEGAFGRNLSNWVNRTKASLARDRRTLLVFLDAINETTDPATVAARLRVFVNRTRSSRVRIVVTCRDVMWEQFAGAFESSLFGLPAQVGPFTDSEWLVVVGRYFDHFQVTATLTDEAARALRRPVLLRFFCVVNSGQTLPDVTVVRLSSVLSAYLNRLELISHEQLGAAHAGAALDLLFGAVRRMWATRGRQGSMQWLEEVITDTQLRGAAWLLLKSEGVVTEVVEGARRRPHAFQFAYDEFMEFALAHAWLEEGLADASEELDKLIQHAVAAIPAFPGAGGALLYLDDLLGRRGALISRTFGLARDAIEALTTSHQIQLLYLFEGASIEHLGDIGIEAMARFEELAAPEIRDRLARVIIRILRAYPTHARALALAARILEADEVLRAVSKPGDAAPGGQIKSRSARRKDPKGRKHQAERPALPPARHHYSEETRLTAIALLVGSGQDLAEEIAQEGIQKVGGVELHTALEAVRALDGATDAAVCRSVRRFIGAAVPEYRIYSSWLLRDRYGTEPAELLVRLLMDEDRRVYEFTARVLAERSIDTGMAEAIVLQMAEPRMAPWHRVHLIRVLARRERFDSQGGFDARRAVDSVRPFCVAGNPQIRIEAYRCLLAFPELIDVDALLAAIGRDSDRYVRALAVGGAPSTNGDSGKPGRLG